MTEKEDTFKCPECGSTDCWFDRTITLYPDGTEDGMHNRCNGCGKTFEELFKKKEELRPCPFCGDILKGKCGSGNYSLTCNNCGCRGPYSLLPPLLWNNAYCWKEIDRLKALYERAVWNLGGCSTYALGHGLDEPHSKEMALPALDDVKKLALENRSLKALLGEAREVSRWGIDIAREYLMIGRKHNHPNNPGFIGLSNNIGEKEETLAKIEKELNYDQKPR
jgi:predicted RNA-binding Zn-ribbon protein involved in translation (DUF1610 family)